MYYFWRQKEDCYGCIKGKAFRYQSKYCTDDCEKQYLERIANYYKYMKQNSDIDIPSLINFVNILFPHQKDRTDWVIAIASNWIKENELIKLMKDFIEYNYNYVDCEPDSYWRKRGDHNGVNRPRLMKYDRLLDILANRLEYVYLQDRIPVYDHKRFCRCNPDPFLTGQWISYGEYQFHAWNQQRECSIVCKEKAKNQSAIELEIRNNLRQRRFNKDSNCVFSEHFVSQELSEINHFLLVDVCHNFKCYDDSPPPEVLTGRRKRQALEKAAISTLTNKEWLAIKKSQNYCCKYCNKKEIRGKEKTYLTKDHVIPYNKGGHNTADNVVAACRSCNSAKGDRTVEWLMERIKPKKKKAS